MTPQDLRAADDPPVARTDPDDPAALPEPIPDDTPESGSDPFDLTLPPAPYPGLRPFEREEWPIFFGRELVVDEVVARLITQQFVVVHGGSGCGKSSLIRAGVLPRLLQEHARSSASWKTGTMLPRNQPLRNFAEMLADLDGYRGGDPARDRARAARILQFRRILNLGRSAAGLIAQELRRRGEHYFCLLIDQFEELFAFADRESDEGQARERRREEAQVFVDVLVGIQQETPAGLSVILTMRSEFLGACARYHMLAEAVNATQFLLPRMEHEGLVRAIRDPAVLYGGAVAPDLAERLIADSAGNPDELPLIQHGLVLLWQQNVPEAVRRAPPSETGVAGTTWTLTLQHYGAAGNLGELLSHHADEVVARATTLPGGTAPDPARLQVVESVFRALTEVNAEGQAIRHPQTFGALRAIAATDRATLLSILDPLRADGVSFLKPYEPEPIDDDSLIDISHEALIRCWKRISDPKTGWLGREFHDGLVWRSLTTQAEMFAGDRRRTLSEAVTAEQSAWLRDRTQAWSLRYNKAWAGVQALMAASVAARDRARLFRQLVWGGMLGGLIVVAGLVYYAQDRERASRQQLALTEQITRERQDETAERIARMASEELRTGSEVTAMLLALSGQKHAAEGRVPAEIFGTLATGLARQREIATLQGHTRTVRTASFSPDGRRIVTASEDGSARVWTLGNPVPVVLQSPGMVLSASFIGRQGLRIVTAHDDGRARIWPADGRGPPLELKLVEARDGRALTRQEGRVRTAIPTHDGSRLLVTTDEAAMIFAVESGARLATFSALEPAAGGPGAGRVPTGRVRAAAFSPDETQIITAHDDGTARLWQAGDDKARPVILKAHEKMVLAVAYSSDGDRVLTAGEDGNIHIWDATDETGRLISSIYGDSGRVRWASFSPDGKHVLAVAADDNARIFSIDGGTPPRVLSGHEGRLRAAVYSPDGARVATVSEDETVRIWRVDRATMGAPAVLRGHDDAVRTVSFDPTGEFLVTASEDRTARVWRITRPDITFLIGRPRLTSRRLTMNAVFTPDLTRLVTASQDQILRVWDAAEQGDPLTMTGHDLWLRSVALSADGQRIVSASQDRTVRLWSVDGGPGQEIVRHADIVRWAAFDPAGTRVVSASADRTARIVRLDGSAPPVVLEHREGVAFAAFSPDGTLVVTASEGRTARIWHADGQGAPVMLQGSPPGEENRDTGGHTDNVVFASFSPDGKFVLTASEDRTAKIWNLETGQVVRTLRGHTRGLRTARYTGDGRILTTAEDGTVRLWSSDTGAPQLIVPVDRDVVLDARLSADASMIAIASHRPGSPMVITQRIWLGTPKELVARVCSRLPRRLDEEGRKQFGLSPQDVRICTLPPRG